MQDYGGPVGFRLALAHPERVRALIIQNAVAHEEGLGPLWETRRRYWADRNSEEEELKANFTSYEATRQRHLGASPNIERYDPDAWNDEFAFLSRPGQAQIQADLFYDYQTNLASYRSWQAWLRSAQPPTLVVWGKYDPSFTIAGATAYQRDAPRAEVHLLEAGHFALDEACDEIAALMRAFLTRIISTSRNPGLRQPPFFASSASKAASRAESFSFSSRALAAICFTASNSSRVTTSIDASRRSSWLFMAVSASRRTPCAISLASVISLVKSSKTLFCAMIRLRLCA